MTFALLALLLQTAVAPDAEVRTVAVSLLDEKGGTVPDLTIQEVALLENGVAREITRLEPDRRPLIVAVLIDSSAEVGSAYRLQVVEAVLGLLRRLPQGSRFALWTTGDRPQRILDLSDDPAAAHAALKRVVPQGGNTLLDALSEATRELKREEGALRVVVAVTGRTSNLAYRDRHRALRDAEKGADLFLSAVYDEGAADFEARMDYDYVLGGLAERSGGVSENPLSVMALDRTLQKLAGELEGRYRLSYATLPEVKAKKLEVQVARPGVKARVAVPRK
jgi:hypothetical protein